MKSQFVIAAASTGAGKTTLTLGLLRAFRRKGYVVQPFKCGPDFIDPIHHSTAAGRDSINLDRFMMSDHHIRELYHRYSADADIAITEGVMGLFDGSVKDKGSAADLAKLLGLPVVVVLDASAMAYSAAAILYGLRHFDPAVHIAGVVFNFVDTAGHYNILKDAAADAGVAALGYLPRIGLHIPSRYLGLDTADAESAIETAADAVGGQLDLEKWLRLTAVATETSASNTQSFAPDPHASASSTRSSASGVHASTSGKHTILIAKDAAFHFLYPENIRALADRGDLHYFSPLRDLEFPVKPDLVYLPGGYPELYLTQLAGNDTLISMLRRYAESGGKILAECGGMMYLGRSITDSAGKSHPMAGILDIATSMQQGSLSIGYRSVPLPGGVARGHEFHQSGLTDGHAHAGIRKALTARSEEVSMPVFLTPVVLASYMHFYWGEDKGFLDDWLGL
jgi:cobyrinic acid a,c-diamide synthase